MKKLITSIVAAITVIALSVSASASNAGITAEKTEKDIVVTLSFNGDMENITNFEYSLYFNSNALTLKSSEAGNVCDGVRISELKSDSHGDFYSVSFVDTTSVGVHISAGTAATLVFGSDTSVSCDFELVKVGVMDNTFTLIDEGSVTDGKVTVEVSEDYRDVSASDWFYDPVRYVTEHGIMNGVDDGIFDPYGILSRAMLVTILYRAEGEPDCSGYKSIFDDIEEGSWYEKPVLWASANGIVNGVDEISFDPEADITREQVAVILCRYAAFKEYDTSARTDLSAYRDSTLISDWATDAMSWANASGLISGREADMLAPDGTASRAEAATVLMRFMNQY